jgi:hypothetical protein
MHRQFDALYHNVEHTMLVTLVGHDIVRGCARHTHMPAEDYAHSIIGCLIHDIGYVRGPFKAEDGYVVDPSGPQGVAAARRLRRRVPALSCRPLENVRDGAR